MTPERERQLRLEAAKRGYDRQKVDSFIEFAKTKEAETAAANTPEPQPQGGALKRIAADIVRPVARAGVSLYNTGEAIVRAAKGDLPGAHEALGATRNLPLVGPTEILDTPLEGFGAGAEIGSMFVGGGAAKGALTLGKSAIARTVIQSAKAGAAAGALSAGGRTAQQTSNPIEIGKAALTGGVTGAAVGGVLGGAAGAISKVPRAVQKVRSVVTDEDSLVARTARRIRESLDKRAELKTQPAIIQKAARVNISAETSHFIRTLSTADKKAAREMIQLTRQAQKSMRVSRRPIEVAGRPITETIRFIEKNRRIAGQQIGDVVSQMPRTAFIPTNAQRAFTEGLEQLGITIGPKGTLNFAQSSIKSSAERRLLETIAKDIGLGKTRNTMTNLLAHRRRQGIFGLIQTAKEKGDLTFTDTIADSVRKGLAEDIAANAGKLATKYQQASQKYAATENILDELFRKVGRKWSGRPDDIVSLRAAEVFNRMNGNNQAEYIDLIERLYQVAKSYGYKGTQNPIDQLTFYGLLEDVAGSAQRGSLRGQVSRAIGDATPDAAGIGIDVATGNAAGLAKKAYDFARGITPEEQLRMLEQLLR